MHVPGSNLPTVPSNLLAIAVSQCPPWCFLAKICRNRFSMVNIYVNACWQPVFEMLWKICIKQAAVDSTIEMIKVLHTRAKRKLLYSPDPICPTPMVSTSMIYAPLADLTETRLISKQTNHCLDFKKLASVVVIQHCFPTISGRRAVFANTAMLFDDNSP